MSGGFTDGHGRSVQVGDRVQYDLDGSKGVLNEVYQDGDAIVTWDDDKSVSMVKWRLLEKVEC